MTSVRRACSFRAPLNAGMPAAGHPSRMLVAMLLSSSAVGPDVVEQARRRTAGERGAVTVRTELAVDGVDVAARRLRGLRRDEAQRPPRRGGRRRAPHRRTIGTCRHCMLAAGLSRPAAGRPSSVPSAIRGAGRARRRHAGGVPGFRDAGRPGTGVCRPGLRRGLHRRHVGVLPGRAIRPAQQLVGLVVAHDHAFRVIPLERPPELSATGSRGCRRWSRCSPARCPRPAFARVPMHVEQVLHVTADRRRDVRSRAPSRSCLRDTARTRTSRLREPAAPGFLPCGVKS